MTVNRYWMQNFGFCHVFMVSWPSLRAGVGDGRWRGRAKCSSGTETLVIQKRCKVDWLCNYKAHTVRLLYNQCWEAFSPIKAFFFSCENVLVHSTSVRCYWQAQLSVISICRCYCETENTWVSPLACAELIESQPATHTRDSWNEQCSELSTSLAFSIHWCSH